MKALLSLVILLAAITAARASDRDICDMRAAREWCDGAMMHRVEGIWEFPEDETRVLIRRQTESGNSYAIIVIESPDTRLHPGDNIGELKVSPAPTKFEMSLYRTLLKGILGSPGKCLAELDEKNDALLIDGRKIRFSVGSRWFLPSFWRAVKISIKNPLDALPKGMIRIYPVYSRRQPDYL